MLTPTTLVRRWLWGLGFLVVLIFLLWKLQNLVTLVLLSFLVAYVLNPLVTRLDRTRFINRTGSTILTVFGVLLVFTALLLFIFPAVVDEFRLFLARLPVILEKAQAQVGPWLERTFSVQLPRSFDEFFHKLPQELQAQAPKIINPVVRLIGNMFTGTFAFVFGLLSVLMFPLFVFFFLKDFPRIRESTRRLVPPRYLPVVQHLLEEVDSALSNFLHGQFTVMLVLATLYSVGFVLVGVPVALGVGLLTGLLCFIPYLGPASGLLLALMLSVLDFDGWGRPLGVIGVFAAVQVLDSVLITPRILGGKLGLRPLWIIIALMAGGELVGFLGVLLAVPTMAVLKVLVQHTLEAYRQSKLYREQPPEEVCKEKADGPA